MVAFKSERHADRLSIDPSSSLATNDEIALKRFETLVSFVEFAARISARVIWKSQSSERSERSSGTASLMLLNCFRMSPTTVARGGANFRASATLGSLDLQYWLRVVRADFNSPLSSGRNSEFSRISSGTRTRCQTVKAKVRFVEKKLSPPIGASGANRFRRFWGILRINGPLRIFQESPGKKSWSEFPPKNRSVRGTLPRF